MKLNAHGFSTELPEGWEDRSTIALVGPIGQTGFAANVVVTRERITGPVSIEDYAADQRAAAEAELPGLEVLDERVVTLQGSPGFQRLQRFEMQGHQVQQAQTYVLGKDVLFAITCSATIADFDANLPAFQQVIDGFQLSDS